MTVVNPAGAAPKGKQSPPPLQQCRNANQSPRRVQNHAQACVGIPREVKNTPRVQECFAALQVCPRNTPSSTGTNPPPPHPTVQDPPPP